MLMGKHLNLLKKLLEVLPVAIVNNDIVCALLANLFQPL